mgnify:CR=1 FL=1
MKSISKKHFKNLYGKKIAVDTNIYMYKFIENNELIENFYFMIALFQYYNIKPIFIFDGKIDKEKIETINRRKEQKFIAEEKYNKLLLEYNPNCEHMIELKKQFTRVPRNMFSEVKTLITLMGETYIDAPCEADELCSWLVISNQVYGCLSEDTDMFAYGCPRILRYISFMSNQVVLYDLPHILNILHISQKVLTQLCVLTGTDYNNGVNDIYLLYREYEAYKKNTNSESFFDWVAKKYKCSPLQLTNYVNICKMFTVVPFQPKGARGASRPDVIKLKIFLEKYNFIFMSSEISFQKKVMPN